MNNKLAILIFLCSINTSISQEKKTLWNVTEIAEMSPMLYRQLNDSIVKTGTSTVIYQNSRYFLLTAAHVAKNMDDLAIVIFHTANDKPLKKELKKLTPSGKVIWKVHSEADIAILELKLPEEINLKQKFELNSFPINQIYNGKELPSRDAGLTFYGYPVIDLDLVHFSALSFSGKISSGLITQKRGDTKKKSTFFYLNIPSIQGCSGSGVYFSVVKNMYVGGKKTILLGIMHGTYSDNTGGKLAAITPSYYIFDLLE